ncbi:hypothetical protein AK812_SmicGene945 [Symbiodinium microadriaticum]|uniref:Uncharacterized protein n=1 Tax=Symbiodinium microadriaticum TaxID=2951 RepID=A0A1Q9F5B6_SYMMI|nr:hypothetical protein AK812_SmicGene945 [Symbiodinium microadriaticum]
MLLLLPLLLVAVAVVVVVVMGVVVMASGTAVMVAVVGITSVLRRNVRHVKLRPGRDITQYYTVFLLNLLVAAGAPSFPGGLADGADP